MQFSIIHYKFGIIFFIFLFPAPFPHAKIVINFFGVWFYGVYYCGTGIDIFSWDSYFKYKNNLNNFKKLAFFIAYHFARLEKCYRGYKKNKDTFSPKKYKKKIQ